MPRLNQPRTGFTLLELMLALALSALVFVAIGMALDLNLRALNTRRANVEESQLARALLRRIADDLRGAVVLETVDFSKVAGTDEMLEAALGSEVTDLLGDETELLAGEEEEADYAALLAPPPLPGIYGNQFQLMVDVSRLPRVDQYLPQMNEDGSLDVTRIPSDVKTVTYYMLPANTGLQAPMVGATLAEKRSLKGGLVRRELDRAVTTFASEVGTIEFLDPIPDVIAPEVSGVQFAYFDGFEWYPVWDTEAMQGLPMAVEVVVSILPAAVLTQLRNNAISGNPADVGMNDELFYRMVVHLPIAQLPTGEELEETEETEESEEAETDTASPAEESR